MSISFLPLLAETILPPEVMPSSNWTGLTLKELLLVLGAVAGVTLLLVIWAVYFRKRPRRHHHHHHHHHHHQPHDSESSNDSPGAPLSTETETETEAEAENAGERRYRRKRRRRREHRPRNPTLAETGGLPPLRSERPSDPLP